MTEISIEGREVQLEDGEYSAKRFYLPGVIITSTCPTCGTPNVWDGSQEYLSHPSFGILEEVDFWCGEGCGTGWSVSITLTLAVDLVDYEGKVVKREATDDPEGVEEATDDNPEGAGGVLTEDDCPKCGTYMRLWTSAEDRDKASFLKCPSCEHEIELKEKNPDG